MRGDARSTVPHPLLFVQVGSINVLRLPTSTMHVSLLALDVLLTEVEILPSSLVFELEQIKGGRVMIAFFVNYSTVAFSLHLPTLKRQQFFGAVANSLGKISYFPLPLDVRRCVAPTGEEVNARQRGVN